MLCNERFNISFIAQWNSHDVLQIILKNLTGVDVNFTLSFHFETRYKFYSLTKKRHNEISICGDKAKAGIKGYDLSNAGRDNCQQGQYGSHSIELQVSDSCNPNTQKENGKGDLDSPAAV